LISQYNPLYEKDMDAFLACAATPPQFGRATTLSDCCGTNQFIVGWMHFRFISQ
jgi:hypothetical protein